MLIKCPTKFGSLLTPISTKISNDIEFNENLQLNGRLTNVFEAYGVQLKHMRGLFLLPQTFQTLLAS